jgi:hypothetical protein
MGQECKFYEGGRNRNGYYCGGCTHPDEAAEEWDCGIGCPGYQLREEMMKCPKCEAEMIHTYAEDGSTWAVCDCGHEEKVT